MPQLPPPLPAPTQRKDSASLRGGSELGWSAQWANDWHPDLFAEDAIRAASAAASESFAALQAGFDERMAVSRSGAWYLQGLNFVVERLCFG